MTSKPEAVMQEETDDTAQRKLQLLDTVHGDEAVKILALHTGPETWEPSEEKRLVRKIDRKLLTILCLTYGLQVSKTPRNQVVALERNSI